MSNFVLDSSALLAAIFKEPGGDKVSAIIEQSVISTVNLTEVVAKLLERGLPEDQVREILRESELTTDAYPLETAFLAGMLRPQTLHLGLSLGDRACLATAIERSATVVTADKAWKKLKTTVKVQVIR